MNALYRTVTGQSQNSQQSQSPHPPPLARSTTTDPLTGTLNHLSTLQEERVIEFKQRLEDEGWWSPDGINGKPTHDDGTLLRFLRARKFDVEGAIGQFTDTEKWYKEQRVDELYEHFDVEFFEQARCLYPQWTGRRDKRGIPIYVYEIKGLDSKTVSKYQKDSDAYKKSLPFHKTLSTPSKLLPLFALYHNLLNFVLPLCSTLERPNPEIPVTNSTNIVDIHGVGLGQFWNLKAHMQDASVLATAHYPETLDRIFIIGAPSFFPTVWGWVKRWFDPVTVSKIFILGKDEVLPTLSNFMELKDIPKKYGGELDWAWGNSPLMAEQELKALETDGHKGWARGPCLWLEGERVVVGSENGKLRRSKQEIAEKKPVIYAADYTEVPVHPERRASSTSTASRRSRTATKSSDIMSDRKAMATAMAHRNSGSRSRPTTPVAAAASPADATPAAAVHSPLSTKGAILQSPSGDSKVLLPDAQPAAPAQTAEYISPTTSHTGQQSTATPAAAPPTAAPKEEPAAPKEKPASNTSASIVHDHPPSQPQPGPLSQYQIEMQKAIANKMQGESVSVIPGTSGANGDIPHPEVLVTSDPSKGLAVEVDKLRVGPPNATQERPIPERFVTASAF